MGLMIHMGIASLRLDTRARSEGPGARLPTVGTTPKTPATAHGGLGGVAPGRHGGSPCKVTGPGCSDSMFAVIDPADLTWAI